MKRFGLTSLIILLIISVTALAQDNRPSLVLSGIYVIPTGAFGDDLGDDAHLTRRAGFNFGKDVGLAINGYGLGVELITPLRLKGISWMISLRGLVDGMTDDAADPFFEELISDSVSSPPLWFYLGHWINIPLMTGFRYSLPIFGGMQVHAQVQAGINFSRPGEIKVAAKGAFAEERKFDFARDFGVEAGVGIDFPYRFTLGVRYLYMDTPRYTGQLFLSEKFFPNIYEHVTGILGEERSISMITVQLGYYLF